MHSNTKRFKKRSSELNKASLNQELKNQNDISDEESEEEDKEEFKYVSEKQLKKGSNAKEYIFSLFTRKIYAEIYFAWCKDRKSVV